MNSNIINSTLILLTISAGIMLTSCSKDDDNIEPVAIETMETDQDQPIMVDNIRIDFKILNTDSVAMKTFKEGENFYFTLSLTNVGTETLYLPYEQEIIGDEAFKVYTADGKYVGISWDGDLVTFQHHDLYPNTTRIIWSAWLTYSARDKEAMRIAGYELYKLPNHLPAGYELYKLPNHLPLPKGSYYTEFEITIHNNKKVKLRKDFKII